jgi:hypothetical protein
MKITHAQGRATIQVKYTIKNVQSMSSGVTGVIHEAPGGKAWTFELSVPIKSFKAPDSDFDSHLQEVTEVNLYPVARATGEISQDVFEKDKGSLLAVIDFHGVKKSYEIIVEKKASKAKFTLDLDAHAIKRPSLLGIKIRNEVLVSFDLVWS